MARSESPIIVPQQTKLPLIKAEITVLKAHLEDWRTAKGKQQLHVLNAIHKEACLQAPTWDKVILKARKKACTSTYKEWLYNQSCRKAPKPLIKYGKKWTGHRVLVEQNKARIREETGETPGSEGMIVKWPEATKTVLAGLSAEEKEEAKVVADKWNNEVAPPEIQASVAESKGADMIEHFATEMFKQAGMRVFVMSAWQDSRGKLMLGAHDFNEQFGGGENFLKTRDWDGIFMPELQQYAGNQFDHGARKTRRDTGRQYNDEQITDGGEVEEEDRKSTDDDEERASIVSNDREEPSPPMVTMRGHHSTNTCDEATQPARLNMIRKSAVALKTPQAVPKSAGTNTRSKGLVGSNVVNDPPTKPLKRRTADPVSDMPAKRTRSKAAVAKAQKSKRSRK
ncbi:hypothetical protein F4604DRAFT_1930278 [Suillus subluteus]|nr:hypothetical protein F4604DRAFT_1930278 [Suillus subluteus]